MTAIQLPPPRYDHLLELIDETGILEHARYGIPRRRHGYTTDDAARALVVLCRARHRPDIDPAIATLLAFVMHAADENGGVHNRLGFDRRWLGAAGFGDHHGRAVWALGVAAVSAPRPEWRSAAMATFRDLAVSPAPHLRPHAFAALGAVEVLTAKPDDPAASSFIDEAAARLSAGPRPWPEDRLSYGNGRIPNAMLAVGAATGDTGLVDRGLETLTWLHEVETRGDRYSFTPAGGWSPGGPRPGFDQQPLEAAAMASASLLAWKLTSRRRWAEAVTKAGRWLLGHNDVGMRIIDPKTGACFDGLEADSVNANQGAESTIAALEVLQACVEVRDTRRPGLSDQGDAAHPQLAPSASRE